MHNLLRLLLTTFHPWAIPIANCTLVSNVRCQNTKRTEAYYVLSMTLTIKAYILKQHKFCCSRIPSWGKKHGQENKQSSFYSFRNKEKQSTFSPSVSPSKLHSFSGMPCASLNTLCICQCFSILPGQINQINLCHQQSLISLWGRNTVHVCINAQWKSKAKLWSTKLREYISTPSFLIPLVFLWCC